MTHLHAFFFQPVSAVNVRAANHQHVAFTIPACREQWTLIYSVCVPSAASTRSVETSRRIGRTFPSAFCGSNIRRILKIIAIVEFFKFDGNIGADSRVVLYEGDVCESLKKEIVAISSSTIYYYIYRPLAFPHI